MDDYGLEPSETGGGMREQGAALGEHEPGIDELQFSSPAYVASLHWGAGIVLTTNILLLVVSFGTVGLNLVSGLSSAPLPWLQVVTPSIMLLLSLAITYGWWILSAIDPASPEGMRGDTERLVLRITLLLGIAIGCASVVMQIAFPIQISPSGSPTGNLFSGTNLILIALGLFGYVIAAITFFAQMFYLRWLARRLPNVKVFDRAKLLMWLGPLLYTVGMLCLGIGPIVALVMYLFLLNWVRKDLQRIRAEMAFAEGAVV